MKLQKRLGWTQPCCSAGAADSTCWTSNISGHLIPKQGTQLPLVALIHRTLSHSLHASFLCARAQGLPTQRGVEIQEPRRVAKVSQGLFGAGKAHPAHCEAGQAQEWTLDQGAHCASGWRRARVLLPEQLMWIRLPAAQWVRTSGVLLRFACSEQHRARKEQARTHQVPNVKEGDHLFCIRTCTQ